MEILEYTPPTPTQQELESLKNTIGKEKFPASVKLEDNLALRVYTLELASIVSVYRDFRKAQKKVEEQEALKKLFDGDFSFAYILPVFIKESHMDNEKLSKSGATGYGQLTDVAIKELHKQFPVLQDLDKKSSIDNIILSYAYHKFVVTKNIKTILSKHQISSTTENLQYFTNFAYNAGDGRLNKLLQDSKAKTMVDLQKYCATKIWIKHTPKVLYDQYYHVNYTDPFWGAKLSSSAQRESQKIYEGVRYASVIAGLSQHVSTPKQINSLGVITITKESSLFSQVLKARNEQNIFKKDANINEICTIILESNGFTATETPTEIPLIVSKSLLEKYLNPPASPTKK